MKTIFKCLAVVLVLSMLMSVSVFAATINGTKSETIELSFRYTSNAKGTTEINSVASGEYFYVFVDFTGNPNTWNNTAKTADGSIHSYDIAVGYDSSKMSVDTIAKQATEPLTAETAWTTGVAVMQWGTAKGGLYDSEEEEFVTEGAFVRLKMLAATDLTESDLKAICILQTATKGSTLFTTKIADENGNTFNVTIPDVEEEKDPVPVTKTVTPVALTELEAADATYTNVAIWKATYNAADIEEATKIGYTLAHSEKPDKVKDVEIGTKFSGDGDVVYVLAFHGVSAEEYAKLTFTPYYVVNEVPVD